MSPCAYTIVAGPLVEPVSLSEAQTQVRYTASDHDAELTALIEVARADIEVTLGRALITQTWDAFYPRFPIAAFDGPEILLPRPPLRTVTAFEWTKADGTTSTWTVSGSNLLSGSTVMAHIDTKREPGAIVLADGASWPSDTLKTSNPVRVRFTAGYSDDSSEVPAPLRQAILLDIAQFFRLHEGQVVSDRDGAKILENPAYRRLIDKYHRWIA